MQDRPLAVPGRLIHSDQKLLTRILDEDGQQRKMHCFAVSDNFSSWACVHCAPFRTATDAATALRRFLVEASFPVRRLLSDNGTEFKGVFPGLCVELRIEHRHTKPDHPHTNGKVERCNRSLREWTANLLEQFNRKRTWAEITEALDHPIAEYHRSPHFGKNNKGLSPAQCVEAVYQETYESLRALIDEATCWVPKGHRLATHLVDEETGEVLR